jgi:hypothetical protein
VANLTASRISIKNMRKSRFFQRDAYISVDFLTKVLEVVRIKDPEKSSFLSKSLMIDLGPGKGTKQISFTKPVIKPLNAIRTELESFYNAITNNTIPLVTIDDGYSALEIAHKVIEKITLSANNL